MYGFVIIEKTCIYLKMLYPLRGKGYCYAKNV